MSVSRLIASHRERPNCPIFSINLSADSIIRLEFLDFIIEEINHYKVPCEKVCFEITETSAIQNLVDASQFINNVKGLGCSFALDDFGSGFSSFAYLKNLPVDYVKIDGIFVKDILHDKISLAMVKSISDIGRVMVRKTVAEYVESDEILTELKKIGVDYVQGFGIAKPIPFDELITGSVSKRQAMP